ncbi:MAG: hypothetical protein ACRD03_12905 [Acidimicrobiales bacterium]
MAERAEAGRGLSTTLGRRRAEYGALFCELPPRGPRRAAKTKPAAQPAPAGERAHATYAKAVVEGCDCELCKAERTRYNRERRQAIARPDQVWLPYVSAEPARQHLAALSAAGMGLKTVAGLSGVSHGSLSKIVYGEPGRGKPPSKRIRPATLSKILEVRVTHAGGAQRVDATGTWQLIEELVAAGYSRGFLARALGSRAAQPSLQIGKTMVRASTARAVEDLHRRLMSRRPPGTGRSR